MAVDSPETERSEWRTEEGMTRRDIVDLFKVLGVSLIVPFAAVESKKGEAHRSLKVSVSDLRNRMQQAIDASDAQDMIALRNEASRMITLLETEEQHHKQSLLDGGYCDAIDEMRDNLYGLMSDMRCMQEYRIAQTTPVNSPAITVPFR